MSSTLRVYNHIFMYLCSQDITEVPKDQEFMAIFTVGTFFQGKNKIRSDNLRYIIKKKFSYEDV